MTRVHDFVCDLAKAGKTIKEIMETVGAAYPDQGLSVSQVYRLKKDVKDGKDTKDTRGKVKTKRVRTPQFIEAVKADVEADRRITTQQLASKYEVSLHTMWLVLNDDLGLSKKSARWVPKLLTHEQKAVTAHPVQPIFHRPLRDGGGHLL